MSLVESEGRPPIGKETRPLVSVVIPTWNSLSNGKAVHRTIRSVVAQGLATEVIVVDNKSRDGTQEVCVQEGARVYEIAGSRSQARNIGVQMATGDFVLFLDSDHELEPGCLREAIRLANEQNLDAVFLKTRYLVQDAKGRIAISPLELELRLREGIRFPNLYRRSSIAGLKFREDLDLGEDFVFLETLIRRGARIGYMSWGLLHYAQAGIQPVWRRSVQYGRAYRQAGSVPNTPNFVFELLPWTLHGLRSYWELLKSQPKDALFLSLFLLTKYTGFLFGYVSRGGRPPRR